jgi:hypothetical protein
MTRAFIFSVCCRCDCGEGREEPPQDGKTAQRGPNKQDGVSNHPTTTATTTTTVLLLVAVVVVTATAPSSSSPVVEVTS